MTSLPDRAPQPAATAPQAAGLRLYGRYRGRRLSRSRQDLVESLLPRLRPDIAGDGPVDLKAPSGRLWLEIGFGSGEHLAWQASRNRDVTVIGAEPYIRGVAALLARVHDDALDNVRIVDGDVRPLLGALAPASLERVFVLFPDPWPKVRHHKRRIVNAGSVARFAELLVDGGELRLATDIMPYARWMLAALHMCPALAWTARRPADWRQRPDDWPPTRYETKARQAGRAPVFLSFTRRPR